MKKLITIAMLSIACLVSAQEFKVEVRTTLTGDNLSQPFFSADGSMLVAHNSSYKGLTLFNLKNDTRQVVPVSGGSAMNPVISEDNSTIYYDQIRYVDRMRYTTVVGYDIASKSQRPMIELKRDVQQKQLINRGFSAVIDGKLYNVHTLKSQPNLELYLCTEGLDLVIYEDAKRKVLNPIEGESTGYIWASLSPDRTKILFTAASEGTFICDLEGNIEASLGDINAPVWFGNDHVVGMYDEDDGHEITSSRVEIMNVETKETTLLSLEEEVAMYPAANGASGKVAYCTMDGRIQTVKIY